MKLLYRGAEAELWKTKFLGISAILKRRVRKKYRIKELDDKIRSTRLKNEAKMLRKARKAINTPHVLDINRLGNEIILEYIPGEKVRDILYQKKMVKKIGIQMGKTVKKLHNIGIVHNDLTTSNFLWNGKLWLIDFGLAKSSNRIEDRATDLVVFKRMVFASHWEISKRLWKYFIEGYCPATEIITKMDEIEKRAKYMR